MVSQFFQNLKTGFQKAEDIMKARQDYRHSVIDPEFYKNVKQGYQGPDRSVKSGKKVNLPGRTLSTFEYGIEEQQNSYPYDFIDDDCKMEFVVTNDMYIRRMFDNWMEGIYSPDKHLVGYKDDYAVDVVIQMLNQKDIPIYGVRLEKAYPKAISGFDLNQDKDALTTLTVDWKYDKFVPEGALSSVVSAGNAVLDLIT